MEDCHNDPSLILNYNKNPCCIKHLLVIYKLSENYLISNIFAKYLIKICKNFYEKENNVIGNSNNINNTNLPINNLRYLKQFSSMLSKYISHFYFSNKTNLSKYLCKISINICNTCQKNKEIKYIFSSIKNNLSCIYLKEQKTSKALNIFQNDNNFDANNLINLNNYINIYLRTNYCNIKVIENKIELLKKNLYIKLSKIEYSNINEIELYLFIFLNYCNITNKYYKFNSKKTIEINNNYKKGFELSYKYLGENHYITIKYKNKFTQLKQNLISNNKRSNKSLIAKRKLNLHLNKILNRLDVLHDKFKSESNIFITDKKTKKHSHNNIRSANNININPINNSSNTKQIKTKNKNKIQLIARNSTKNEKIFDKVFEEKLNEYNKQLLEEEQNNTSLINDQINFNKIDVSIDNDGNNNDYECNTLFFIDQKLKDNSPEEMVNISLCDDDDSYRCETFFINAPENIQKIEKKITVFEIPKLNVVYNKDNNDNYECQTFFLPAENNGELPKNTKNQLILKNFFIDIKYYHPINLSNFYREQFDIFKYLNSINHNNNDIESKDKCAYQIRYMNDKNKCMLKLEMLNNENVKISLLDKDNKELSNSIFTYTKILNLYKDIRSDLCLNYMETYANYTNLYDFIKNTFLYFITSSYVKEKYNFYISKKKPLGLCHYIAIDIPVHFCQCQFDILVLSDNICRILLSSKTDHSKVVSIDTFFDTESFKLLISKKEIDGHNLYYFVNEEITQHEKFIGMLKKLQKCLNAYCSDRRIKIFDDIYDKTNIRNNKIKELITFKLYIENNLNDMCLYGCEFNDKLCKVVSVNQDLVKLNRIIYSAELKELFGYDTNGIWKKIFIDEKYFFGVLMLNSVYLTEDKKEINFYKFEIIDELNLVQNLKICHFALIKLNNVYMIKVTIYMSVGSWDFNKMIFVINSKEYSDGKKEIKLKNIKDKLHSELLIIFQSLNKGEEDIFSNIIC